MYTQTSDGPLRKSRGPLYTHQPVGGETLTLNAPDLDITSKSWVRLPVYRRNSTAARKACKLQKKNQPLNLYFIRTFNRFQKDVMAHN